jgi:hypothetical protein
MITYYAMRPTILVQRNQEVFAQLEQRPPQNPEPFWYSAQPISTPLPELVFTVAANWSLPDNLNSATEFDLYSRRLLDLLAEAGVVFETFPARLVERRARRTLGTDYAIFHLLEIDFVTPDEELAFQRAGERWRPALDRPMFRHRKHRELVLVREDLKKRLDAAGVTGCWYSPIQDFNAGWTHRLWKEMPPSGI